MSSGGYCSREKPSRESYVKDPWDGTQSRMTRTNKSEQPTGHTIAQHRGGFVRGAKGSLPTNGYVWARRK